MTITATEFKTNFGKYLDMVENEDIFVTKNGKTIGVFSNPNANTVENLRGILKGSKLDEKNIKDEMIADRYGIRYWFKCNIRYSSR